MSRTFSPGPAYRVFLNKLYEARIARGHSIEQLSEIIGLTPAQIAAFEAGEHPLTFTDVRNWLLALDVPFVTFAKELDDALDSTLETDEGITFPGDAPEDEVNEADKFARAEPLPHQVPTIQVLFFTPGAVPEVRRIENTLEAKQALVEGLITTFETGVSGIIGIANDEALLEDMPLNRPIPMTGGHILVPFWSRATRRVASVVSRPWSWSGRSMRSAPKSAKKSLRLSSPRSTAAPSGWKCGADGKTTVSKQRGAASTRRSRPRRLLNTLRATHPTQTRVWRAMSPLKTSPQRWPLLLCCLAPLPFSQQSASRAHAQGVPQGQPLQGQLLQGQLPQGQLPQVQRNIVYGEAGGEKLLLDVYGANPALTRPAIIFVHGGSWMSGSKADLGFAASLLARQGYVGFSINYRLLRDGKNRFPAQIDDVQRVVRWVRAHAAQYGVDPQKVGALGASAGGHLVALLGTTDTRDNSDAALAPFSSRVQCVVDLYGPTDFTAALDPANTQRMATDTSPGPRIVREFLGPLPEAADNYRAASPLIHIDKKSVPFLIFHGGKDDLVPLDQSQRLDAALRQAGIESRLVVFPEAGHGYRDSNLLAQTFAGAMEFFDRHLKRPAAAPQ